MKQRELFSARDQYWLEQAIELALRASSMGEVPVGAVLVHEETLIGMGYNCSISTHDPTAHAEMIALRESANKLANYRLVDTTLYTTLEPCMMCAGAIVHSRIKRLIFGAFDLKAGAVMSQSTLLDQPFLNHRVEYAGGLLANQCGDLLSQFFKERRTR